MKNNPFFSTENWSFHHYITYLSKSKPQKKKCNFSICHSRSLFCLGLCKSYIAMTSFWSIIFIWSQDKLLTIHSFNEQQNMTWQRIPRNFASINLCVLNLEKKKDFHTHKYIKHICLWVNVYDHVRLTIKNDCSMSSTVLIGLCIFIPLVFK